MTSVLECHICWISEHIVCAHLRNESASWNESLSDLKEVYYKEIRIRKFFWRRLQNKFKHPQFFRLKNNSYHEDKEEIKWGGGGYEEIVNFSEIF